MEQKFIQEAVRLAGQKSESGENGPFGALIVKNGEIISRGWNRVVENGDPTAHAEITAIREACRKLGTHVLDQVELYSSCEPCPMCLSAIYWARIPVVYFAATKKEAARAGFDDQFIYDELSKDHPQRSIKMVRLHTEDFNQPFEAWLKNTNRKMY